MKRVVRENITAAYSLHDMNVIEFEVYGYNQTKYMGYLTSKRNTWECIVEIYHLGDMVFVEE